MDLVTRPCNSSTVPCAFRVIPDQEVANHYIQHFQQLRRRLGRKRKEILERTYILEDKEDYTDDDSSGEYDSYDPSNKDASPTTSMNVLQMEMRDAFEQFRLTQDAHGAQLVEPWIILVVYRRANTSEDFHDCQEVMLPHLYSRFLPDRSTVETAG
ncbi:hypothetical protein M9H77_36288 [Catharanthus roseus]|uniref:Uncharacterized protein n=1 Tax=Catharanthus roseus TaxID=4058 RepID=A0ACB9ZRS2_CATRO|nr:hypothetical protein M9H77_36288 [Catharanthus roseus]